MGTIKSHYRLSRTAIFLISILYLCCFLNSCKPTSRERPYGYLTLGPLKDLVSNETDLKEQKLLLRRDKDGLYVMSTMCTYDLTYLERRKEGEKDILASTYTDSKYDLNGKVISGPSITDLPYYQLKIDSGVYAGPKDTLYVYIGKKVSKDWRLPLQN